LSVLFFLAGPLKSFTFVFVSVVDAEFRINVLFWKNLYKVFGGTARKLTVKFKLGNLCESMLEDKVLYVNCFVFLCFSGAVGDVSVEVAILGYWMANKLLTASRFLADFMF